MVKDKKKLPPKLAPLPKKKEYIAILERLVENLTGERDELKSLDDLRCVEVQELQGTISKAQEYSRWALEQKLKLKSSMIEVMGQAYNPDWTYPVLEAEFFAFLKRREEFYKNIAATNKRLIEANWASWHQEDVQEPIENDYLDEDEREPDPGWVRILRVAHGVDYKYLIQRKETGFFWDRWVTVSESDGELNADRLAEKLVHQIEWPVVTRVLPDDESRTADKERSNGGGGFAI